MTIADYEEYVAYSRQHFEEGLSRAGFIECDSAWRGAIRHPSGSTEVEISFRARFPFQPPRVVPIDPASVAWSWHRELDGALCLVAEDDHDDLWWTEASALLEHVTAWFEQADAGWPDDRLDLDLERYFRSSQDERLYLYDNLASYLNGFVRFRPSSNNTMRVGNGTRLPKVSNRSKDRFGYVADLGDIDVPPRSWQDVAARIAPDVGLDRRIRNHLIDIVVLIYRRGAHDGAIVLEVWPSKDGGIAVRRLRAAADTTAAKTARAGVVAPLLNEARVAIVGVGAIGSFTADLLLRAGIRHLTLVDDDIVKPGNLIRHLVGPEMVGLPKVTAVKRHVVARHEVAADDIKVLDESVLSFDVAMEFLTSHDLVVDTSADFATTALLHVAARSARKRIISASIQNDGATYRVDLLPPLEGADPLPSSSIEVERQLPAVFEAGCGSPISPTPPHVAVEAASATVRHVIGLLTDRPVDPSGEVRNLVDPARAAQ